VERNRIPATGQSALVNKRKLRHAEGKTGANTPAEEYVEHSQKHKLVSKKQDDQSDEKAFVDSPQSSQKGLGAPKDCSLSKNVTVTENVLNRKAKSSQEKEWAAVRKGLTRESLKRGG